MNLSKNEVSVKELLNESEGLVLMKYEQTENILQDVVKKFSSITEVTSENFDEAKKARAEVREFRYSIQNVTKHNSGIFNQLKKSDTEQANKLIGIIQPTEDLLDNGIKAIEEKKKREKEEKERKEQERITSISKMIADYKAFFDVKITIGKTQEELDEVNSKLEELKSKFDEFMEFRFEAEDIYDEYSESKDVIQKRIDEEVKLREEQRILEEQKQQQEKERLELEKQKKELEEQKAEIEKQKAEAEAQLKKQQEEAEALRKKQQEEEEQKLAEEREKIKQEQIRLVSEIRGKQLVENGFSKVETGYELIDKLGNIYEIRNENIQDLNSNDDMFSSLIVDFVSKFNSANEQFDKEQKELEKSKIEFSDAQKELSEVCDKTQFIQTIENALNSVSFKSERLVQDFNFLQEDIALAIDKFLQKYQ
jgi:predicted  nucleic acid-binding Zn-ribbon protein